MKRNATNRSYYLWCLKIFSNLKAGRECLRREVRDDEFSYMQWSFSDKFFGTTFDGLMLHREVENLTTQEFITHFWSLYEKYN